MLLHAVSMVMSLCNEWQRGPEGGLEGEQLQSKKSEGVSARHSSATRHSSSSSSVAAVKSLHIRLSLHRPAAAMSSAARVIPALLPYTLSKDEAG